MAEIKCEVCNGQGDYPIIDNLGSHRYSIRCPECFGAGQVEEEEVPAGPADWPPPSTASKIKSVEELKQYLREQS